MSNFSPISSRRLYLVFYSLRRDARRGDVDLYLAKFYLRNQGISVGLNVTRGL